MKNLEKKEMIKITGGTAFGTSALNALMRAVSVMFSLGQAVGTAIRRASGHNYCS